MGTVDEFSFTMRKFDQTEVHSTTSVKDLYESTAFRLLHLYLCSKTVNIPAKKVKLDASLENNNTEGTKEINKEPTVTDQVLFAENNGSNILANTLLEAELTYLDGLDESVISNFDDEVLLSSTTLETTYENNESLKSSSFEIKVHRGHVLKELIQFFTEKDTASLRGAVVHVTMILPNGKEEAGEDNGGVMRDMLSEFWQTFYDNLCEYKCNQSPLTKS